MSSPGKAIHLTPAAGGSPAQPSPSHPALRPFQPSIYLTTSDAIASNLLIILPGLGDAPSSFASLASTLFQRSLPQTSILILRPPKPIPFLADDEGASERAPQAWWDAFDFLTGDTLLPQAQNPGGCLSQLGRLLDYLSAPVKEGGCGWPPFAIHLFGYAQGGTAALETAISWTRSRRIRLSSSSSTPASATATADEHELGSVVSVCGPLLSSPGGAKAARPPSIPILAFVPSPSSTSSEQARLQASFTPVAKCKVVALSSSSCASNEPSMIREKADFDVLFRFWSSTAKWRNRSSWEVRDEGVYDVRQ
ncbi:hypothetical protein V8E36_000712 [Tilletia maclaganii]